MMHLSKDHLFPLIMAGNNVTDLLPRYNIIVDKLVELESQVKKVDAGFDISHMWTVSCTNGKMIFDITSRCVDIILKNKMMDIFSV